MTALHIHIDRVPLPWQHAIGRRCATRLMRAPIIAKRWGQRRKPNLATVDSYVDRTVEDLAEAETDEE